ncbi:hypothetical protein [Amphritea balenae]|uniref:Uncharacterized protein n=1 Tax=Amphritea balenae TaxID=452629 RepID=A0A3P1SK37_9GAMM|nr:hypothetical protein [Amphritea balenae]RRC97436.1 hypothetical protein EHS89_18205 [Amphritea balenae]GGK84423.1 hypothetical protein GCM10007941_38650 [Amphritea balenae]
MGKVFLWIAAVMLVIFTVKTQYLTSKTWTPFKEGCMAGGTATEEQCSCLSDYVHKHFSDKEVESIMQGTIASPAMREKVEGVIRVGSKQCKNS